MFETQHIRKTVLLSLAASGLAVLAALRWSVGWAAIATPVAVGAIAIGAGALVGALVPETEKEREMLGDASREVTGAVRDTVSEATSKAEQKVDEAERSMSTGGVSG